MRNDVDWIERILHTLPYLILVAGVALSLSRPSPAAAPDLSQCIGHERMTYGDTGVWFTRMFCDGKIVWERDP